MNRNYTDVVKFVCCILIFLHHFYLGNSIVTPLGYLSCAIFFFLSAWGVSKSLDKKELSLYQFIRRRVAKVYIPLLLVNLISIAAAKVVTQSWTTVPIFSVFCDEIQIESVESSIIMSAYLFDVFQTDSITWFVHVLLLVYLFVWAIHKIDSELMYAFVVISIFVVVELVLWLVKAKPWYMVDIVGVLLGLLIYKFEYMLQSILLRRFLSVVSILLLIASLGAFSMHTEEHRWVLLTGFVYSVASVILIWLMGMKTTMNIPVAGILGEAVRKHNVS